MRHFPSLLRSLSGPERRSLWKRKPAYVTLGVGMGSPHRTLAFLSKRGPTGRAYPYAHNSLGEHRCMPQTEGQFKGIRGVLWLALGFLLLLIALGCLIYIVSHLTE